MSKRQPTRAFNPVRTMQKFAVSAFVVFTFVAYAVHEQLVSAGSAANTAAPANNAAAQPLSDSPQAAPTAAAAPTTPSSSVASNPAPAQPVGQYKNGTYTGPEVDAFYGLVKVQAVVQNGKLANVRFLEYPNDRRTSVRINSVAVPYLQSEAVQAQGTNVDFISGATLTSEAFVESLQAALDTAKN